MNSSLRKEMNKRYNFLTQAQHTQKGSDQWRNYKKKRNLCTKLLRSAELSYWKDKFSNVKSNAEVCKVLAKSFQGTNKSYSVDPIKDLQGSHAWYPESKCFKFLFYKYTLNLEQQYCTSSPSIHSYIYRVTPTLPSLFVNQELVFNWANRPLKEGKACGPDNIGGREPRLIGDAFTDRFFFIARKSFADCRFPKQWKTAQVKCIH